MYIYIDESGNFVIQNIPTHKISCVGALIIPSNQKDEIYNKFLKIKSSWGFSVEEIKGSKLNENQISEVITLLSNYDILVEIICIDMGMHNKEKIDEFKKEKGNCLTNELTSKHHPNLIKEVNELKDKLMCLSNQLFIQSELTMELIKQIINSSGFYYSLKHPQELSNFNWIIDGKNSHVKVTNYEEIWTTILLPFMQSNFKFVQIKEGDYSYMKEFFITPEQMPKYFKEHFKNCSGVNLSKIMKKSFKFEDSKNAIGLQLIDIIISAFSRAMNSTLKITGWKNLGFLMIHTPPMVSLNVNRKVSNIDYENHRKVLFRIENNLKQLPQKKTRALGILVSARSNWNYTRQ